MAAESNTSNRLIDYIFLVGPSAKLSDSEEPSIPSLSSCSSPCSPPPDWQTIFSTRPDVIWRYPKVDIPDRPLTSNITYFCQPEINNNNNTSNDNYSTTQNYHSSTSHHFLLTNTETNVRTYGTCISFPYLSNSLLKAQSHDWQVQVDNESVAIQEWGLLSVGLLSTCDNFTFFHQILSTFIRFIDHFCGDRLSWDLLVHSQYVSLTDTNYSAIWEVLEWVKSLISLPIPKSGLQVLEVELEVDPAVVVGYPPSSRLPLVDLPIHEIIQKLDVHLVIEIYKLLLLEHKVIVHSKDFSFSSQCVLAIMSLFYPLQYLFPVIPLLPTCLPNAENLLLVPTPFFIGVPSSFLKKITMAHKMETWIVDLDNKKLESPIQQDLEYVDKFPLTLLQLQADLRQLLDKLEEMERFSTSPVQLTRLKQETDVLIRVAFAEFLLKPEMLGCVDSHLTIYRLFPRPVVDLRKDSFLEAYIKKTQNEDTDFINHFVKSQSVEYYMEWVLNPSNKAFEEIRKGFCELERIGDKQCWWVNKVSPELLQFTLYSPDPDSFLYQEMLNHKTWQVPSTSGTSNYSLSSSSNGSYSDEDSDFEEVGAGYYHEESGLSSSVYYSDAASPVSSDSSSYAPPTTDIVVDIHPLITITSCTPLPPTSSNEMFLPLIDTVSNGEHVPLPPSECSDPEDMTTPTGEDTKSLNITDVTKHNDSDTTTSYVSFDNSEEQHSIGTSPPAPPITISGSSPPITVSGSSPPITVRGSSPPITVSGSSPPITVSGSSPPITVSGSSPPITISGSSPPIITCSDEPFNDHVTSDDDHVTDGVSPCNYDSLEPSSGGLPRVGSWMNLRGPLVDEMLDFTSAQRRDKTPTEHSTTTTTPTPATTTNVVRSVPWSAVSSLHELETQIKDIVGRVGAGHGLPWPKSAALKSLILQERSRIALLRLLELRLGVREQTNLLLSADGEIVPVVVSRSVYRGVLDLLKYILQPIETELHSNIDTPIFSLFLILRLALCICTVPASRKKKTTQTDSIEANHDMGGRSVSPVPKLSSHLTNSSNRYNFNPLPSIPVEIEMKLLVGGGKGGAPFECKRVRSQDPVSHDGGVEVTEELHYLHLDLLKGFSVGMKEIIIKRHFWNSLFSAIVQADRKYLGWNEKTAELYDRYKSLPTSNRKVFSYEEDALLSVVLHNILIFLLMVGISPTETMDVCHRISARCRLATAEEKLLQATMSELENVETNSVNINNLAILALYSERHPIITYIVHHGISVTAPIFKLQITDEVCILRRFPDERITCRYWNDHISNININTTRLTISFLYHEDAGDYYHHFHSKQYKEIQRCLVSLHKHVGGKEMCK